MSTLKVNTIQDASGNNPTTPALLYNGTAKAWVNFNGTGSTSANQTIRSSYNCSSVFKNATGNYTVNFMTAMPDTNYCNIYGGLIDNASASVGYYVGTYTVNGTVQTKSTTALGILMKAQNDAAADGVDINVAIFR